MLYKQSETGYANIIFGFQNSFPESLTHIRVIQGMRFWWQHRRNKGEFCGSKSGFLDDTSEVGEEWILSSGGAPIAGAFEACCFSHVCFIFINGKNLSFPG